MRELTESELNFVVGAGKKREFVEGFLKFVAYDIGYTAIKAGAKAIRNYNPPQGYNASYGMGSGFMATGGRFGA